MTEFPLDRPPFLEWGARQRSLASSFFSPLRNILSLEGQEVWVAGGSVIDWLVGLDKPTNDFDLFTTYPVVLAEAIRKEVGPWERSAMAYSFNIEGAQVQVVRFPYPSLDAVLKSFDTTVSMAGIDFTNRRLILGDDTLADLNARRLRANQVEGHPSTPVTSLYRLVRYGAKGFTLSADDSREFLTDWGVQAPRLTERVY